MTKIESIIERVGPFFGAAMACGIIALEVYSVAGLIFGGQSMPAPRGNECHAINHTGQTFRVVFGDEAIQTGHARCYTSTVM